MNEKWVCDNCVKKFKLKRELISHLREELEEAEMQVDLIVNQLEDLGVKNLYEEN